MKYLKILLLLLLPIFIYSCKDDDIDLIQAILPAEDIVSLKTDTFHIDASTINIDSIPVKNTQDSWILGTYIDSLFGGTTAEIFTQFNCPTDMSFPADTISGSTKLVLLLQFETFFTSYARDSITISAYEMDKATFSLPSPSVPSYYSNIKTSDYTNKTNLLGVYKSRVKNIQTTVVEIPLSNTFKAKLLSESVNNPLFYATKSAFVNNLLKGIYLTLECKSNKSAMMKITGMEMQLKFAYPGNEGRTIDNLPKVFPASMEVRRVNKITHDYLSDPLYVPANDKSIVYVNSPAGKNVGITIPLKRIKERLGITTNNGIAYVGNKKLSVNHGLLKVEVVDFRTSALPKPDYLLLIKKSEMLNDAFFKTSGITDNVKSIVAAYDSITNSYSFDLGYYLANEFKSPSMSDSDELELIPVSAVENTDGNHTVSYNLGLYGASIRTKKKDNYSPLKLNVLISGF